MNAKFTFGRPREPLTVQFEKPQLLRSGLYGFSNRGGSGISGGVDKV